MTSGDSGGVTRCADGARERGDPWVGTAAPTRAWLLVEHPGPWPITAVDGVTLGREVRQRLARGCNAGGVRLLIVRRPAGRTGPAALTSNRPATADATEQAAQWWLLTAPRADAPDGGVLAAGRWSEPADLLDAADAAAAARRLPAEIPAPDVPRLLVCTHGRHDVCCAVRGRPVAASLAGRWPETTWECSHLGGDRFAANLLVVPDGTYYAAVDETDPVELVERHLGGEVNAHHLRGSTTLHPWEQAALVEMHRRRGPFGPTDIEVETTSTEEVVTTRHWRVRLRTVGGDWETVEVHAHPQPAARLTCRSEHDASVASFEVRV